MEHISTTTLIVTLIVMVVISAYFSGSETGMMTLNRYRLRHMAKQGNRQAKRVEKLLRKPDRLISLVLIGNNLVNILASALGTIVGMRLYGDAGVAIATGVLTFVVLVFAEVLPKTIAALYPEKVAYPSSLLLAPLQILMMPLVWLLNTITRILMRMMGIKTDIVISGALSKDELRTIVNESRSQISRRNQDMLLSVLDLEKVSVDDIMVPRNDIVGININDDWKSIVRQLTHSPHGRIVLYRDTLDDEIKDRAFFANPVLTGAVDKAKNAGKAVHIMGLLSAGGVHSHEDHIMAMVELAAERGAEKIYLHAFLDGRDTPPRSAESSLKKFEEKFAALGKGRVASIIGRYYAMDRDNRWDRVEKAYDLLTLAQGEFQADTAVAGLQAAYARDENDEFVKATVIRAEGQPDAAMEDGDALIFMNFRADRAREITRAFVNADFDGFARKKVVNVDFVMLTEYAADIKTAVAYPPASLVNTFGEWMAKNDKTQLRISETEKYAHVTFFFNGGVEESFKGEDRILINSPKVATYDLQPEMSSAELTEKLVAAIKSGKYDTIICNYPNGDMVGHTGVMEAAVKAVEALDHCVEEVAKAVESVGGQLLITADHGNAEQMRDPATGQAHTAHTNLPVPLIYVGDKNVKAVEGGKLSDIAPTMLSLMGMEIPQEMTGKPLFIVE